jgi:hypothetical protein
VDLLQEYINFTSSPIRFLRVDNAKEFTCPVMVNLCNVNNIILQVVVSYDHLMQARVEGAIGICKQHTRVALAVVHVPVRFWPAVLTDFRHKRNFLWSSVGDKGHISTAHERLGPAFAGTFRTVAVPFGCRVTSTLPIEHRKVTNKSFGNRYAEGIYLHSHSATPSIWMFDMISKTVIMVSDFKDYPAQFPMRDPTCLVSVSFTHKDVQAMHNEDVIDDADLAEQSDPPLTRSRAQSLQVLVPATPSVLPAIAKPIRPEPLPPVSIFDQPFLSMTESELATAFLNNTVDFILPSHYCPTTFAPPEAEMIVTGTRV